MCTFETLSDSIRHCGERYGVTTNGCERLRAQTQFLVNAAAPPDPQCETGTFATHLDAFGKKHVSKTKFEKIWNETMWAKKVVFDSRIYIIAIEGPARCTLCGPVFLAIFKRVVLKNAVFLNQVIYLILERFALFLRFIYIGIIQQL